MLVPGWSTFALIVVVANRTLKIKLHFVAKLTIQKATWYKLPGYPGKRRDESFTFGVFPNKQSKH